MSVDYGIFACLFLRTALTTPFCTDAVNRNVFRRARRLPQLVERPRFTGQVRTRRARHRGEHPERRRRGGERDRAPADERWAAERERVSSFGRQSGKKDGRLLSQCCFFSHWLIFLCESPRCGTAGRASPVRAAQTSGGPAADSASSASEFASAFPCLPGFRLWDLLRAPVSSATSALISPAVHSG